MSPAPEPRPTAALGRIWLIGSMGAGKSAVGRALGALLGVPVLDNDRELADRTGETSAELAHAVGDVLHEQESAQLRAAAAAAPPFVAGIAASVADRPADLALLQRTGTVIHLRAPAQVLAARVAADLRAGAPRPWLDDQPYAWLTAALQHRERAYTDSADLVVDTSHATPEQLAVQIAEWLAQRAT